MFVDVATVYVNFFYASFGTCCDATSVIERDSRVNNMFDKLGTVVRWGCATHCFLEYIGDVVWCTGPSMEPTIFSNDILLTDHLSPRLGNLNKGDIIIAKCPSNPRQHICKRITGLPGDKVRYGFETYVVPVGHVWLEGDNGGNSTDSRIYGAVPQGLLRARVLCTVWPPRNRRPQILYALYNQEKEAKGRRSSCKLSYIVLNMAKQMFPSRN